MQYSKLKHFKFRSRNGKRQAILTYVQAYGDCRFSRRSPQFFSSLIPFQLLTQNRASRRQIEVCSSTQFYVVEGALALELCSLAKCAQLRLSECFASPSSSSCSCSRTGERTILTNRFENGVKIAEFGLEITMYVMLRVR